MNEHNILNDDCMNVLPNIQDESAQLIIADPPFNVGYKGYDDNRKDYKAWCESWIKECFRVLKPTGSFFLMSLERHLDWLLPTMSKYGVFRNLITWKHHSSTNSRNRFAAGYIPILLYSKTDTPLFNTYVQRTQSIVRWGGGWEGNPQGQMSNIWDDITFIYAGSIQHKEAICVPGTAKKCHPCQMPLDLAIRMISFCTNENDLVIDPFCGSGTVPVACAQLNRNCTGAELDKKFHELIMTRLSESVSQTQLPLDKFL